MSNAVETLPRTIIEQLVAAALAAPSMHNTQPWRFSVESGGVLRVHADGSRLLPIGDPGGRGLYMATGAALHNLELAARRLGFEPEIRIRPEPTDPAVLAEVRLTEGPVRFSYVDEVMYRAIERRHTNRFPFRRRPIPQAVVSQLGEAADVEGVSLLALSAIERENAIALVYHANRVLESDALYVAEMAQWTSRRDDRVDGVPATAFGRRPEKGSFPVRDFAVALRGAAPWAAAFEPEPQLFLTATEGDLPADWLRGGAGLQRVLLVATTCGLSASFLYQPFQIDELRARLRRVVGATWYPQMLLRLGHGREVSGTRRRPPADALTA